MVHICKKVEKNKVEKIEKKLKNGRSEGRVESGHAP